LGINIDSSVEVFNTRQGAKPKFAIDKVDEEVEVGIVKKHCIKDSKIRNSKHQLAKIGT
jgi:hypothetical protein